MRIWALLDDRAGNNSQVLGVAEALDMPFEQKKLTYTKWVKLHNIFKGATPLGIDKVSLKQVDLPPEELPDLLIGAGRRIFPLMRYLKKKSKGKTHIVQIMNPGKIGFSDADLIVLPKHDNYQGKSNNVMQTLGSVHRVTEKKLAMEKDKWQDVFKNYPSPRISVIVGGSTKKMPFTKQMAEQLAWQVLNLNPASVLVTTSRRTPNEAVETLKQIFPKDKTYFYQYGDAGENPYFGLLAFGNRIVVTGDSMSMCSEACAVGVPVYIFAPKGSMGKKHALFHSELYASGYASALGSGQTAFGGRLNEAVAVADKIKTILNINN